MLVIDYIIGLFNFTIAGIITLFLRSLHLFQLNPILGPIATWMTRVVKDVFVIFWAWFVFYLSFVFGIHLVLNNIGDEPNCTVRIFRNNNHFLPMLQVFFIEGQIRIGYKMLKKLLFHVGFGFRMEVTMGYLISDQFKTHF